MKKVFVLLFLALLFSANTMILAASEKTPPDIAKCALANFPKAAKKYVDKAEVTVSITVDKIGTVRAVRVINVELLKIRNAEKAKDTIPLFRQAAIDSLVNRTCPIYRANGVPVPYKLEVPLLYELR